VESTTYLFRSSRNFHNKEANSEQISEKSSEFPELVLSGFNIRHLRHGSSQFSEKTGKVSRTFAGRFTAADMNKHPQQRVPILGRSSWKPCSLWPVTCSRIDKNRARFFLDFAFSGARANAALAFSPLAPPHFPYEPQLGWFPHCDRAVILERARRYFGGC
jgi:hypothetical protein